MFTFRSHRRLLTAAVILAAALASGLTGGGPGSALAASCPPPPTPVYPFAGDPNGYVLATGGDFSPGSAAWTLSGGAARVADQAPDPLVPASSMGALYLPAGGSATSPCVTAPHIVGWVRMFAKSVGSTDGQLSVQVIVHGATYPAGTTAADTVWGATRQLQSAAPFSTGAVAYQVRLTAVGSGAAFAVDDVYVDPLMHR